MPPALLTFNRVLIYEYKYIVQVRRIVQAALGPTLSPDSSALRGTRLITTLSKPLLELSYPKIIVGPSPVLAGGTICSTAPTLFFGHHNQPNGLVNNLP